MVTMASPRASRKPAIRAAALPKLRRRRTTAISGSAAARSASTSEVPSVDPSSTKSTSVAPAEGAEHRQQLLRQGSDRLALVVDRDDHRDEGEACGHRLRL